MEQMTINKEHLEKLREQFCIEYNCEMSDFTKPGNIVTQMAYHEGRRKYTDYDPMFRMVSFYDRVIVTCGPKLYDWAKEKYWDAFPGCILELGEVDKINKRLAQCGQELRDLHHYFLAREDVVPMGEEELQQALFKKNCHIQWYNQQEIAQFDGDERYSSAYGFLPRHPDIVGVAARDKATGEIMAMAGASAEGEHLAQIGINVNQEYRGRGLGVFLVTLLKDELIRRDKVPFYGMVSSHTMSMSIAIRSGFFPVWTEVYSGPML